MKTPLISITLSLCLFITVYGSVVASAPTDESKRFFTFTFENDIFLSEDDGYTNGTGISFGKSGFNEFNTSNVPSWIHWLIKDLYINTELYKSRAVAHMFFQRMQTPTEISDSEIITDDLPYAGLLAWQGSAYSWDDKQADQLSLYLGWVGSATLSEQAHKAIHRVTGSDDPKGWSHQLSNEPVVKVEMQRIWRVYRDDSRRFQFDVIGLGGAGIGNLASEVKAGFAVRWGTNLSASLGAFSLQADRHVNPLAFTDANDFYFFAGACIGYVANDILINGNTFTHSPSLALEHVQNEIAGGAVWGRDRWAFVFALSSSSAKTALSDDHESYGAISVTYKY